MTRWRVILLALASAAVGALIAVVVMSRGGAKETDAAKSDEAPAVERVSVVNGETVVTLDAASMEKSHIVVAPLAAGERTNGGTTSYAIAADVSDLIDARNQLSVARAQAEQAHARATAADAEAARLRALHADNRNISDRVLQEGEANARAEHAGEAAAAATMRAASSGVEQRWGSTIAHAFAENASWIDDLIANRKVLVRVVAAQRPPQTIALDTQDGSVKASFVSQAVRGDARVQGRSWLYLAPAGAIVPGMSVTVHMTNGALQTVAMVPHDAIVWSGGRAWVYVERGPGKFGRVAADSNLSIGTRVVVEGAQQLLSEEAKPKIE